ncbi:MAG: ribonuclease HI family protein [Candidatus Bathyarchaeota archaeon]|nr:ribonuclease HI family protein [Candidatus Bathyarchaeota archaeon]
MYKRLIVYSDGGARGNPGPAAAAFLVLTENGQILKSESRFLGNRTNNQAEYEALVAALETAVNLGSDELYCYLDSELVAKHLSGEYHVKNVELHKLWNKIQSLRSHFKEVRFVNVPRTNSYIQKADALVNETLDRANKKKL